MPHLNLFVVEALQWNEDDQRVLNALQRGGKPIVVLVNKVDKIQSKERLAALSAMNLRPRDNSSSLCPSRDSSEKT